MRANCQPWTRWGRKDQHGSLLMEVSLALGLAVIVALIIMRASLLAISGNQWTMMQTLTDAYMTRETALSNRTPLADVIADSSPWPDWASRSEQNVTLGKMPGGRVVQASLTRFRINIPGDPDSEANLNVFRLYSVLKYQIGEKEYVKSRSTLRMQ